MKKLLITSLAAMSLLAFGACGGDDDDKDNGKKECTSSADCADGKVCSADGKCVDSSVTPTGCTSNADCAAGETCNTETGKCVDSSVTPTGCTSNADCAAGETCNTETGKCVDSSVTPTGCDPACGADEYCIEGACVAEGDACDPDQFEAICDGNTNVYCGIIDYDENGNYIYAVAVEDCVASNMTCGNTAEYGAFCVRPCDTVDELVYMCDPNPKYEGDLNAYICVEMEDGGFGAPFYDYETCSNGCNAEANACNKLVEDEGDACDSGTFTERCDGSILVYCLYGQVVAGDCSGEESATACGYSSTDNYADCVVPESCQKGAEPSLACKMDSYGDEYSVKTVCVEASDGTSGEVEIVVECSHGCDETTGECTKLVENEGESCNAADFKAMCGGESGNIAVYCYNGAVTAWDCSQNDGYSCLTLSEGNLADCYSAEDSCEADAESTYSCSFSYSLEYVCAAMSDGKNYYYAKSQTECSESQYCSIENGLCEDIPTGWDNEKCTDTFFGLGSYYGDGDCDCGCGVQDVDCADASLDSCKYTYCEDGKNVNATQNWICE